MKITMLIPAYNEAASIRDTVAAVLAGDRIPDQVVVVPNGCSDNTVSIAREFEAAGVIVLELPKLKHKKSEALNRAWRVYAMDSDIVICLDADTVLPPNAVADWEKEFEASVNADAKKALMRLPLGGSSSKFTMRGKDFLTCLQRAEFAKWTDTALIRGWTSVLAGTGCAISGEALRRVVELDGREGPWSYDSQVEDFELTYQIRQLGYRCQVSPTVRAYTDSMKSVKSLWGQRMKWQVGTVEDLMRIGFNRLTALDWAQQAVGLLMAFMRILWVLVIIGQATAGILTFVWYWWIALPLMFAAAESLFALRIPHRSRRDLLMAATIVPQEIFAWLRAGWFLKAWWDVLVSKVTKRRKDRWSMQYSAEGMAAS